MRLAQVSDTHFGTERPEVVAGLLRALRGLEPDAVAVSGDITQRARESQFQAARHFIDALPGSGRIVIPGNHDLPFWNAWLRFTAPYSRYEKYIGPRESLWSRGDVAILALDATHPRRRKDGHLPAAHLQERLRAARSACGPNGVLVVIAHQPLWTAWGADKAQTLIRRHETARLLSEGRADVVMSGHVHVPMIATSATSDPQLAWRFVLSGAGTAVSHRTREGVPNSFNLLELEHAEMRVARYDWDGRGFAQKEKQRFRRDGGGWGSA